MAKSENYYGKVIMPKKKKLRTQSIKKTYNIPRHGIKYICLLFISYLMGTISFFIFLNPVGISFLSVFMGKGAYFYGICLSVFMGYITSSTYFGVYSYALSIALMACITFWLDGRSSVFTEKKKAAVGSISLLAGGIFLSVLNEMSIFILIRSFAESFAVFALSMLMDRCVETYERGIKRKMFTDDEALSMAVMGIFIVVSLSSISVFGLSLKMAVTIFFMLCVSYKGGAAIGGAAGSLLGFILIMCGKAETSFLCVISFAGIMSGFFGRKNRVSLVLSFAVAASIPAFYMGMEQDTAGAVMSLIAVAVFFAIPERYFDIISTYTTAKTEFDEDKYYIKVKEYVEREMKKLSESFNVLSYIFTSSDSTKSVGTEGTRKIVDMSAERVCGKCGLAMYCWKAKTAQTYGAFYSLINEYEEKGTVKGDGIKGEFAKTCVKTGRLIEAVESCCREVKGEKLWKRRLEESRSIIKEQLQNMSGIIEETAQNLDLRPHYDQSIAKEIQERLLKKGITVKNIFVREDKKERFAVSIESQNCGGCERCSAAFLPEISASLGRRMELVSKDCTGENCISTFEEGSILGTSYVYAQKEKSGSPVSGDSFKAGEFRKGTFTAAVSDGMGTGEKAAAESSKVIEYLERLVKSGFDEETAAKVINCSLMAETEDIFATLDIVSVDLRRKKARIIKNGGSWVFIIRAGRVTPVISTSLPLGISVKGESEVTYFDVEEKDIILMITDGISDAFKDMGIENAVKEIVDKTENTKALCDEIIKKAISVENGQAKDDMLAFAIKVYEN